MIDQAQFVHLKVHSEFSLVDGLVRVKALTKSVSDLGMPAVALTDVCNFFGLIKFYKAANGAGLKPIAGSDLLVRSDSGDIYPLSLLVQNLQGYKNLTLLISRAYRENQTHGVGYIKRDWLKQHGDGLIALSAGRNGDVGAALVAGRNDEAAELLQYWMDIFPDRYYMELQRTGRENEGVYIERAVALADSVGCPIVATNDVRFLTADEFEAHEARVCIHDGVTLDDPRRDRRYTEQQYLRTPAEMIELFSDLPDAIANTVEIAKRCTVDIELGTYYLPEFPIPDDFREDPFFQQYFSYEELEEQTRRVMQEKWAGREDTSEYAKELVTGVFFRKISHEGLNERLEFLFDTSADTFPAIRKEYLERLNFELDIILQMGFPGYFLIVMDFIQWAKDNGIPVGPGRGSGAGSLVAYAQKITDLDPIQYDLLFERFLNPERVSMPDFDIDFCMENRDKVINYVAENYGREAVSQIVTFGTMAAKAVVRDVARVQGKSYGLADKLSKMIPFEVGMTLAKAYEQEEILRDFLKNDDEAQEIWDMALQLEGVTRGTGKHAGGVVIAPSRLTDFAPLYCDDEGNGLVTQFDKNDVEEAGLVKFDFLGLRTLTIIDWAVKMINRPRGDGSQLNVEIERIPLTDPRTFALLKRAETTAVFQLESRGMKDLIKRLQPDNLEDMIALVALFRPGPLDSGMVDDFVNRKHGRAEVAYPDANYQHKWLEPILKPTYGVIVYQEQVMQIAQTLAGYSLGGADLLRRAMGKKKPEEMAKQRSTFEEGAKSLGVDPDLAMKIFDLVEKFAGYGFNKSHSAAYALVSYQTAYLKATYPAEFMAATMSSELQNTDKIVTFIEECRAMKLPLRLPDVNEGEYMFTVNDVGEIVYGLGAIKGLGEGPINNLIEARHTGGPFTDLFDFCRRTDSRKINKRALEALIRGGAFDSLGVPREVVYAAMPEAVAAAEQNARNEASGMIDLFGEVINAADEADVYHDFRTSPEWSHKQRLSGEKDTLGLYVTGHPIDEYERDLRQFVKTRICDMQPKREEQLVAGLIIDVRTNKTRAGDTVARVTLDDRSGRLEVSLFGEVFDQYRESLQKDTVVVVSGVARVDHYSGGMQMNVREVFDIGDARSHYAKSLVLNVTPQHFNAGLLDVLQGFFTQQGEGGCPVVVAYQREGARAKLMLGTTFKLSPGDEVMQTLRNAIGKENVYLNYSR